MRPTPLLHAWWAAGLVLLSLAGPAPGAVVPAAAPGRPKVCLVLSGGGARGAAHVGVLKVLEELRVPVDCVVGTSMGSIVGAAYASGVPVAEMERVLGTLTTRILFEEALPRQERSVHLKQDDASILATPEIGVASSGVLLPKGLVSGVQLEGVLRGLSRAPGYRHFDELPIPYRAVATDLVTGKPFVLDQGELAAAMRASMSVPGVIEPARLAGRLLVDGGLTDNLPVDVARAMGADVVIAVNLGTPLMNAQDLTSVIGVTSQMVSILTEQNVQASLASLRPTDILVVPRLDDFSARDFDHLADAVPIGAAAARSVADLLARYAVGAAEYAEWSRRRTAPPSSSQIVVDEIRFEHLERVNPEVARSVLQTRPGEPVDPQALDRDMLRLFGTGDFEHVSYSLLEEPGRRILSIDAVEKAWGPGYLRAGLGLSSDFAGDAFFNLLGSYRMTWVNRLGGEWRVDAQVGRTSRLATSFYQPLQPGPGLFLAPTPPPSGAPSMCSRAPSGSRFSTTSGAPSASTSAPISRITASCAWAWRPSAIASASIRVRRCSRRTRTISPPPARRCGRSSTSSITSTSRARATPPCWMCPHRVAAGAATWASRGWRPRAATSIPSARTRWRPRSSWARASATIPCQPHASSIGAGCCSSPACPPAR